MMRHLVRSHRFLALGFLLILRTSVGASSLPRPIPIAIIMKKETVSFAASLNKHHPPTGGQPAEMSTSGLPEKLWSVIPPMLHAARPVDAVTATRS